MKCKFLNFKFLFFLFAVVLTCVLTACKKYDIKVNKGDNKVEFKLTNNWYRTNDNYSVGYTNKRNSTYFNTAYIKGDSSTSWTATLSKDDDYYFSAISLSYYPYFTMDMYVNDKLYKTLTIKNTYNQKDPYVLSGKLESE